MDALSFASRKPGVVKQLHAGIGNDDALGLIGQRGGQELMDHVGEAVGDVGMEEGRRLLARQNAVHRPDGDEDGHAAPDVVPHAGNHDPGMTGDAETDLRLTRAVKREAGTRFQIRRATGQRVCRRAVAGEKSPSDDRSECRTGEAFARLLSGSERARLGPVRCRTWLCVPPRA